jgi:hypothetical protein
MTTRLFAVAEAYYYIDGNPNEIAGVPEYERKYYGEYTGVYPYQAASKAFTGLQKHIKKFYKSGDWFPGYDPEEPPVITFKLVDVNNDEADWYQGYRIPAHQGVREVINKSDGRIRRYRWENKVVKINHVQDQQDQQDQQQDDDFNPEDLLD